MLKRRQRLIVMILACVFRFLFPFFYLSIALLPLEPGKKVTQYNVQVWNMESGLPGNNIFAVLQTHDGYLWLGTQDGLVRFDGVEFETFNRDNTPQLKDNNIRALYEDPDGVLWVGTTSGGLTRCKDGKFETDSAADHKFLSKIKTLCRDRWGNLWIGSKSEGLTCYNNETFTTYTTDTHHELPDNKISAIYKDGNGDLWITTEAGIVELIEPGVFKPFPPENLTDCRRTTCLHNEKTNELWVGTGDRGLLRYKDARVTTYGIDAGLPNLTVTSLYLDGRDNLWIGTDGGGLTRFGNGVFTTLSPGQKLADGHVYAIYEDLEKGLWVGTVGGGLHQLKDSKFILYTTLEGFAHDYINCIYQTRDGNVLAGTNAGLNRVKDGSIIDEKSLSGTIVLSIMETPEGTLWIGTTEGLHRFASGFGKGSHTVLTTGDGLSHNKVNHVSVDRRGNVWAGTENGLNRFDPQTRSVKVFTKAEGLAGDNVLFVFQDSRGTLWVGTDAGISRREDGSDTAFEPFLPVQGADHSSRFIHEDAHDVLWFGTDSGLVRLDGDHIKEYTGDNGLIDNQVYSILEDDNYLWLAGPDGVSRVLKAELEDVAAGKTDRVTPEWFNEKDGMESRWCTGTACKTRDGRLWFPTKNGAAVLHPRHIRENTLPPSPIIKKLIVEGVPVNIRESMGTAALDLGTGKKRVEFHYTGIGFINPKSIRFKLKLEPLDKEWVEVGTVRSTTYTALAHGKYTFRVIAANAGDEYGEEISVSFRLQPYFWQTDWFMVLIIFLLLAGAFSFYRLRVRQLKRRQKELGVLVDLRTREVADRNRQLESQSEKLKEMDRVKSRFFANISHEFRTPLTLIMGPLEQMLSDAGEDNEKKKITLMLRNSQRLLGLINQLLELSKFESGKVKLRARLQNIVPLLRGIVANFGVLADRNELDLTFQTEDEEISLYIDAEKIEDVVSNLLINAVKFTPPGGKIILSLTKSFSGELSISVSDTGPGIPPDQLGHIFDRFYQSDSTFEHRKRGSGIGLALVKELVQLHHGKIDVYSREGKGTEFIISLPFGSSHLEPSELADSNETAEAAVENHDREPVPGLSGIQLPSHLRAAAVDIEPYENGVSGKNNDAPEPGKDIILVVEDSADVREYIRGALEPQYTIMEAGDGEEGLRKAVEIIPDLIISDIMMPGIDGYELLKTVKKDIKTSHIPVILLTARVAEENIVQGLETGADDYITKPFSTRILAARVANLIELRRQLHCGINREMTFQPEKINVSPIDRVFLKELREVIRSNISDTEFNVEGLAKKLYMDRSTVYRKVLALTGETPTDFIRTCRLKRGAELLRNNYGSVLEVALEVGFSSANYFTKCFKKKFHQLPSSYQASQ